MIKKKAYAKINLFLNMLEKRKDGYHNLEMVNAKIDLFDDIQLKKCQVSSGIIIKSNDLFLSNQDNVVLACARHMQEKYHIDYGIEITIDKRIPYGAGLGGNSSDAAAVIHGINELAELSLTLEEMQAIGEMFGADIPYCLIDDVAFVTKTGEVVKPIHHQLKGKEVLVIHPKKHIMTKDVFNYADTKGVETKDVSVLLKAIEENALEMIQKAMFNSLEAIVMDLDEEMREFKQEIVDQIGDLGLVMTGSGSTFIQLILTKNERVKTFITENKDKFLVNRYKIV